MFTPLRIPNAFLATGSSSALPSNAFLFATPDGNVLVDPLPFDAAARHALDERGGLVRVVALSPERAADARAIATHYGVTLVDAPPHRDVLAPGLSAIRLEDQAEVSAFAVLVAEHRAVVAGDYLAGVPAGALSLHGDAEGATRAALGLRRILREDPETLLLSRGYSLFANAYAALYHLIYSIAGAETHRINLDQLDMRHARPQRPDKVLPFGCDDAEVGFAIGARKLGYRVSTLEPGDRFCPLHGHAREEELFYVIDGAPSVRMLAGTIRCRAGDFVALPTGESGTHQLLNESDAPATVMLLSRNEDVEICYYPDSDKLLVEGPDPLVRGANRLLVRGTPGLDYYDGEDGTDPPLTTT